MLLIMRVINVIVDGVSLLHTVHYYLITTVSVIPIYYN